MMTKLEDCKDIKFHIFGGEVGKHTSKPSNTMDFSLYYPFFHSILEYNKSAAEGSKIAIGSYNFPSNGSGSGGGGNGTSAAINLEGCVVWKSTIF